MICVQLAERKGQNQGEFIMAFREIQPTELKDNVFRMIGGDWLLVSGEAEGKANAMTASWGGMGVLWGKPVVFIFIRPQRYTKEFVDKAEGFALSVLDGSYRQTLNYFGTVSGRTEDKIKKAGLTPLSENGRTYFTEARLVLLCRKLYAQPLDPACFIDKLPDEKWYPEKDYHTMYVAEIEKVLVRE